jgi:hypothetical protein
VSAKLTTWPSCCTTIHRVVSPGARNMECAVARLIPGYTRWTASRMGPPAGGGTAGVAALAAVDAADTFGVAALSTADTV